MHDTSCPTTPPLTPYARLAEVADSGAKLVPPWKPKAGNGGHAARPSGPPLRLYLGNADGGCQLEVPPATSADVSQAPALKSKGATPASVLNMGMTGRVRAAWCPQWQGPKSEHLLALTAAASAETETETASLNPVPGDGLIQLWLVQTSAEQGAKGADDTCRG
jgi:hypothetical protein